MLHELYVRPSQPNHRVSLGNRWGLCFELLACPWPTRIKDKLHL